MPIYQGTYFVQVFVIEDTAGDPVDITGWEFEADFRRHRNDEEPLLTLTTGNGGFAVALGTDGRLTMQMTEGQTIDLPAGRIVFDVLRVDASPGPRFMFAGTIPVKQPVTRDD